MSINLEMPTEAGLKQYAPEKSHAEVRKDLGIVRNRIIQIQDERKTIKSTPKFVPAGQTTQMVIGAHRESDWDILHMAKRHYQTFNLKRVYYSGYIPINQNNQHLPVVGSAPPLLRENRLYQSDWLMRVYGFELQDIVNQAHPNLDLDIDPKLSWALRNPHLFPVDLNRCPEHMIARIPGIGIKSAKKIAKARRFGKISVEQLKKMGIAYNRARFFIECLGNPTHQLNWQPDQLRQMLVMQQQSKYEAQLTPQLSLGF